MNEKNRFFFNDGQIALTAPTWHRRKYWKFETSNRSVFHNNRNGDPFLSNRKLFAEGAVKLIWKLIGSDFFCVLYRWSSTKDQVNSKKHWIFLQNMWFEYKQILLSLKIGSEKRKPHEIFGTKRKITSWNLFVCKSLSICLLVFCINLISLTHINTPRSIWFNGLEFNDWMSSLKMTATSWFSKTGVIIILHWKSLAVQLIWIKHFEKEALEKQVKRISLCVRKCELSPFTGSTG